MTLLLHGELVYIAILGSRFFRKLRNLSLVSFRWNQRILMYPLFMARYRCHKERRSHRSDSLPIQVLVLNFFISYEFKKSQHFQLAGAACGREPCTGEYILVRLCDNPFRIIGFIKSLFVASL